MLPDFICILLFLLCVSHVLVVSSYKKMKKLIFNFLLKTLPKVLPQHTHTQSSYPSSFKALFMPFSSTKIFFILHLERFCLFRHLLALIYHQISLYYLLYDHLLSLSTTISLRTGILSTLLCTYESSRSICLSKLALFP